MGIGRNRTWGNKYSNTNFQKRWLQKKENCCDPDIIPPPPPPLPFCIYAAIVPSPVDWSNSPAGDFYINGNFCPAAQHNPDAITVMQITYGVNAGYMPLSDNSVLLWAYTQNEPAVVVEDASLNVLPLTWVNHTCDQIPVCYVAAPAVISPATTGPDTMLILGTYDVVINNGNNYDNLPILITTLVPPMQGIFGATTGLLIETDGFSDVFRVVVGPTVMIPTSITNTDAVTDPFFAGYSPCPPVVVFQGLVMTFGDVGSIPFDPTDVTNWNLFMYASGTPFSGVAVVGNVVTLYGYNNTGLLPAVFLGNGNIIGFVDQLNEIIALGNEFFKQSSINFITLNGLVTVPTEMCYQCGGMTTCSILGATSIGSSAFQESAITSVYGPSCLSVGTMAFKDCAILNSADFPVCTSVGMMGFHITSLMTVGSFPLLATIGDYGFEESNLSVYSDFTAITNIGIDTFENSQLTGGFVFNFLVSAGGNNFGSCNSITDITCPNLPAVPDGFCSNCAGLTYFSASVAISVGVQAFTSCTALFNHNFTNVETFGSEAFDNCTSLLTVTFDKMLTGGANMMRGCTGLFEFRASLATNIGPNHFENCTSLIIVDLLVCADLGGSPGDNNVFLGISGNAISIVVPTSLQTIDGGNPDGDLVYVAANNTATITYA